MKKKMPSLVSLAFSLVSAQAGISKIVAKVNYDVMKRDYFVIPEEFLSQTSSNTHLLNYQYYNI